MSARTTPSRKQQLTLSPAVATAVKDATAKKQANEKKKEQLHAQVAPLIRKPPPRTHVDLMRAGLMLEQQRLRAMVDDASNKDKLLEELDAKKKSLDDHVTRRDNLNRAISDKRAELKTLQAKVDSLPEEATVRLELFGIEALLNGQMELEQPAPELEWNGGEVFRVPTPVPEEGELEVDDPLAAELLS